MQDPLRAFLTGKRSAKRHALEVPVQISGPAVWIVGESIDVSSNGVCLRVALSDMFDDAESLTEDSSFELVKIALDEGVKLLFPITSIVAEATPVRVALDPDREGWLQLGCRFAQNLGMLELSRLGLDPSECGPENPMYGPPSKALPVQMNGGLPIRVSLFAVNDRTTRIFEGKLVALGQQSLAVTIHEDDPHDVLRRIGCLELYFRAIRDGEVVWDSRAMIAALPMASAQTGQVEIGLVASSAPCGNLMASGLAADVTVQKKDSEAAPRSTTRKKAAKKQKKKSAKKKSAKKRAARKRKATKKSSAKKRAKARPSRPQAAKPATTAVVKSTANGAAPGADEARGMIVRQDPTPSPAMAQPVVAPDASLDAAKQESPVGIAGED